MKMIDIGCGRKGASKAMSERGWNVVTLDIDPKFSPDIIADIRTWKPDENTVKSVDLVWASPPCNEFSRESMPWCRTGNTPDLSIVEGCVRVIREVIKPRFWILENVRGAVPYFEPLIGKPRAIFGAFFLWGFFPEIPRGGVTYRKKESYGSTERERRAEIPYSLSLKIAESIESAGVLL